MPAKTSEEWRQRIYTVRAEDRSLGALRLLGQLEERWGEDPGAPGERTVRTIMKDFDALPSSQQQEYELVRWPESFGSGPGGLPWEAAMAVAELHTINGGDRATVRRAKWFYRVTLARPSLSALARTEAALALEYVEMIPIEASAAQALYREVEALINGAISEEEYGNTLLPVPQSVVEGMRKLLRTMHSEVPHATSNT